MVEFGMWLKEFGIQLLDAFGKYTYKGLKDEYIYVTIKVKLSRIYCILWIWDLCVSWLLDYTSLGDPTILGKT